MSDFLPQGTAIPTTENRYMKFTEPENKFRVLGSAIVGFELWVEGKPIRKPIKDSFTTEELTKADINKFTGKKKVPQYFWAFPVFNYQTQKVEILELTQSTIMRGIEDYLHDPDYGNDPQKYDLNIIKDGVNDKIEYRVKAKPPKDLDEGIVELAKSIPVNLNALFSGGNPFESETAPVI